MFDEFSWATGCGPRLCVMCLQKAASLMFGTQLPAEKCVKMRLNND